MSKLLNTVSRFALNSITSDLPSGGTEVTEREIPESVLSPEQVDLVSKEDEAEKTEETQEHIPGEVPSIEKLKAMAENGDLEFEDFEEMVRDGEITPDQFREILQVDYEGETEASLEAKEAGDKLPGISDNLPVGARKEATEEELELLETLSNYKPIEAYDTASAEEKLRAALDEVLEIETRKETNLRSQIAIAVADFVFLNGEGLGGQNKLVHVHRGMYDDILKEIGKRIAAEDRTNTFNATVGSGIEGAILVMAGKAKFGYFMLAPDRKTVRDDIASLDPPRDVPQGYKVLKGICVKSKELAPAQYKKAPGNQLDKVENTHEEYVLLPLLAQSALYKSLWDRKGRVDYDTLSHGRIIGFTSGAKVADEEKAKQVAADKQAVANAEAERKAGEADQILAGQPNQPEPDKRDIGGVVADAATPDPHMSVIREILNSKDTATTEDMGKFRLAFAKLEHDVSNLNRELAHLRAFAKDDIVSVVPAFRSIVRDQTQPLTTNTVITQVETTYDLIQYRVLPQIKPGMDRALVRDMVSLCRLLNDIIDDRDDVKTVLRDKDGTPVETFENI